MNIECVRKGKALHLHRLSARFAERIAPMEEHLREQYSVRGIDLRRFRWSRGFDPAQSRSYMAVEFQFPLAPRRNRFLRMRGPCVWVSPWWWHNETGWRKAFEPALDALERIARWRKSLAAAGYDPDRPPATAYSTDLISRLVLDHHRIDGGRLVGNGAVYLRTPNYRRWPSIFDRLCHSHVRKHADEGADFGVAYPGALCDVDVDRLSLITMWLTPELEIRPDSRSSTALIGLHAELPLTIVTGSIGTQLRRLIEHPAFDDPRIVVRSITESRTGEFVIEVEDPMVPLSGPFR